MSLLAHAITPHSATFADLGQTTAPIDTTGCNFLVVWLVGSTANAATPTLTDSNGNIWTYRPTYNHNSRTIIAYCRTPIVGPGHTFTAAIVGQFGRPGLCVMGFSEVVIGDDQASSNFGNASSITPGSILPGSDNQLFVCGFTTSATSTTGLAVSGGFTIADTDSSPAVLWDEGKAFAYLIQTTAAAANPTWSWGGGAVAVQTEIVSFTTFAYALPPAGDGSGGCVAAVRTKIYGDLRTVAGGSATRRHAMAHAMGNRAACDRDTKVFYGHQQVQNTSATRRDAQALALQNRFVQQECNFDASAPPDDTIALAYANGSLCPGPATPFAALYADDFSGYAAGTTPPDPPWKHHAVNSGSWTAELAGALPVVRFNAGGNLGTSWASLGWTGAYAGWDTTACGVYSEAVYQGINAIGNVHGGPAVSVADSASSSAESVVWFVNEGGLYRYGQTGGSGIIGSGIPIPNVGDRVTLTLALSGGLTWVCGCYINGVLVASGNWANPGHATPKRIGLWAARTSTVQNGEISFSDWIGGLAG